MNEIAYNVDEVFEIAMQIERNGAAFYRSAAELSNAAAARTLLLSLAEQEDQHERTFSSIRAAAVADKERVAAYDQDDMIVSYLKALAGQYVFLNRQKPRDLLSGREDLSEILNLGAQREKDSIVFYLGLIDALAGVADKNKVRRIIWEEQKHLADLLAAISDNAR